MFIFSRQRNGSRNEAGKLKIGILALQGAVEPHCRVLLSLGATPLLIKTPEHLKGIQGIILPGGESTTMLHLLDKNQLFQPLQRFVLEYPSWGICAGAILLAKRVTSPDQRSLAVFDITLQRNGFGRQKDSFISVLGSSDDTINGTEAVFIRAPRIKEMGSGVKTIAQWQNEPVMVEQNHLLCTTFHPELSSSTRIHEYFLRKIQ